MSEKDFSAIDLSFSCSLVGSAKVIVLFFTVFVVEF